MFFLALIIGKILAFVLGKLGRGSNIPGEIALRLCPSLLGRIHCSGKIIAVTGSNGKTTTANTLSHVLEKNGYKVINNAKGSNLTGGVATALLTASDFRGNAKSDFVVLEVDERYSPLIFRNFQPDILLVTNLFRDQLTRNGNIDIIIEKLQQAIRKDCFLIVNANDPISSDILPENKRAYYAMAKTPESTEESVNITHDAKVCPRCFGRMEYEYFHYNHIGKFHCSHCGYAMAEPDWLADDVDLKTGSFTINRIPVQTSFKSLFNILNMTAAAACASYCGLKMEDICSALSSFTIMKQRYEEFDIDGRKALMILSKNQNPVSYDQSISHVLSLEGEKSVIAVIRNINHTYEKDTTWLYDIAFERLLGKVDKIICCGERAYDLAYRLEIAGFAEEQILVEREISQVKPLVQASKGTLCILTELYDAQDILKAVRA